MLVCGPDDLKTLGGTDSATEAPFSLRGWAPELLLFQATTEPFCGKGFFGLEKEKRLSCNAVAKPLSGLGKNEQGWYFSGLEKNEGPAR